MRNLKLITIILLTFSFFTVMAQGETDLVELSQQLLRKVQAKENTASIEKTLSKVKPSLISKQLNTDNKKLAFWINIYNGYIQVILNENPDLYKERSKFFAAKQINIAGHDLSFEKIEHGFIRQSQKPAGLGYVKKVFPGRLERKWRVDTLDYRIHFALNCGAKSCPPVGIYSAENLDSELDYMMKNYLKNHTTYDQSSNTVTSTTLFSWFRGDFGGKEEVKSILKEQGLIPSTDVTLKYEEYDWTLYTNNFVEIPR